MPIEYVYTEPEQVTCMKIKVPVVLAEVEAQVLVDTTTQMPELTKKVDHIDVKVRDLEAEPVFVHETMSHWHPKIKREWYHHFKEKMGISVVKKVIVHGVLHKQIFYVNKNDEVKHHQEEVSFTKMIELREPQPVLDEDNVVIQFPKPKVDITWELVRGSRLQQTGVIIVKLKIVEERQIYVQLCPSPEVCPPGNLLEDPGLEQWVGNIPVFWGATANVAPTSTVHGGSRGAELGTPSATTEAAIFQTVRNGIAPGLSYKLTFWARENAVAMGTSAFTLTADVRFFNRVGQQIDGATQSWPSGSIPDTNYDQFSVNVPASPAGSTTALVRLTFTPSTANTNTLKIDDVNFECIGGI